SCARENRASYGDAAPWVETYVSATNTPRSPKLQISQTLSVFDRIITVNKYAQPRSRDARSVELSTYTSLAYIQSSRPRHTPGTPISALAPFTAAPPTTKIPQTF